MMQQPNICTLLNDWNNSDYGLQNYGIQETSLIITTMKLIQCSELKIGQSTYTYMQSVSLCKLWKPKTHIF
jgi:hypothetical protein